MDKNNYRLPCCANCKYWIRKQDSDRVGKCELIYDNTAYNELCSAHTKKHVRRARNSSKHN